MDDPWRNAWSAADAPPSLPEDDPWKPALSPALDVAPAVSTWEPPAWPEDPIHSATVWDSGASSHVEPEGEELEAPSESAAEEPVHVDELESEQEPETEPEPEPPSEELPPPPAVSETPVNPFAAPLPELATRLSRSPSPDAFGSFETADETPPIDDAWREPAQSSPTQPAAERSLWSSSDWQRDDGAGVAGDDEWAAASARHRLEEERQRRFPKEAVDVILAQWESLATDLWPPPSDDAEAENPRSAFETRLDNIPGLAELMASIVPDYHLQPVPPFLKTSTFKSMQTAIRLTKSYAMVQASPLSQFYSSKGNSAWESSLKAKEVVQDDFPWEKPQEPAPPPAAAPLTEKPARGGFMSLWSRRPPSMPPQPRAESSAPASRTASPAPQQQRQSIDKPRPSIDSAVSAVSKDTSKASTTSSPIISSAPTSIPDLTNPVSPVEAAPSTMSRLFGRFSRSSKQTATTVAESPSNTSIALSASDVSFLSDVVPSTSGSSLIPQDDILGALGAPSSSRGSILPAKLPAPLAPPPKSQSSLLSGKTAKPSSNPSNRWDFEDDDELSMMQEETELGATLDAFLGAGTSSFQQGYAPLSSAQKKLPVPVPTPPRVPMHTAILPSSVLAVERDASTSTPILPPPPPPTLFDPPVKCAVPPPSSLLGDEEFDDFMSTPAQPATRTQSTPSYALPTGAPLMSSSPMSHAVEDDFGDFGDFMSPPTSPPMATSPAPRPQPPPVSALPPPRKDARLPEPPRANTRTPVAVMSRSGSLSVSAPPLAPPPGSLRAPAVVMSRSTAGGAAPAPLLAPPPGSSRLASKQNLLEEQDGDLLSDTQPTSPASASTSASATTQQSSIPSPIRSESRSSLPVVPRSESPSLFEDLMQPVSRSSLSATNGVFSTVPVVSSPLAQPKATTSPSFNGDAFSLFNSAPAASYPRKDKPKDVMPKSMTLPASGTAAPHGKLSAADLSFFDSL